MTKVTPGFEERQSVVVRFAGDSGDGMQTVGERFTDSSVMVPNAIATFPDFPAEIRAPAGTIPGVSAFQVHFGSREILTPGDEPDALIAMNPAALKVHLDDLTQGGLLVVNTGAFTDSNLEMAGYESNPLEDPDLSQRYEVVPINISELTKEALKDSPLKTRDKLRCKNFFALGFTYWVYGRPLEATVKFVNNKWGKKLPDVAAANVQVLKSGYFFGETSEIHRNRYSVTKAAVKPGTYRKISGNEALVLGLVAAARQTLFHSGNGLHLQALRNQVGTGRGRNRGHRGRRRGQLRRLNRHHRNQWTRHVLEVGIHGTGHVSRAASGGYQCPTGRTQHGIAHQD
jgi:2-oxoglutarate ferredoxin oxidoreductase subunit alpha